MSEPADTTPSNPRNVSEDQGLKSICELYGADAFEVFAPTVVAKRGGPPVQVRLLQQEVFSADLGEHSTSMDVPLLGIWPNGSTGVLLLVEHHAEIRKVRPKGLTHYISSMVRRLDDADVYPVLFVTDHSDQPIPDHYVHVVDGEEILRAKWTVVRLGPGDLPRLRAMQGNHIAAVLRSLTGTECTRAAVDAIKAMLDAGFTGAQAILYLPLIAKFAKMTTKDQPRFRLLLQAEVPQMRTFIDDIAEENLAKGEAKGVAKGKAEGEAKGKAKGEIDAILRLVAKKALPVKIARADIEELVIKGTITRKQADAALAKIG